MKKMSLLQLSFIKERISDELKKSYVGGGDGTINSPYTWDEYQGFLYSGNSSLPVFYEDRTGKVRNHSGVGAGMEPYSSGGTTPKIDLSPYIDWKIYKDEIMKNNPNFNPFEPIYFQGGTVSIEGVQVLSRDEAISLFNVLKDLYSGGSDNNSIVVGGFDKEEVKYKVSKYVASSGIGWTGTYDVNSSISVSDNSFLTCSASMKTHTDLSIHGEVTLCGSVEVLVNGVYEKTISLELNKDGYFIPAGSRISPLGEATLDLNNYKGKNVELRLCTGYNIDTGIGIASSSERTTIFNKRIKG